MKCLGRGLMISTAVNINHSFSEKHGTGSLPPPTTPPLLFLFPCSPLLFILLSFWYAVASATLSQKTDLSLKAQSLLWFYSFCYWANNSCFCSTSDLWLNGFGVYIFSFIGNLDNVYCDHKYLVLLTVCQWILCPIGGNCINWLHTSMVFLALPHDSFQAPI